MSNGEERPLSALVAQGWEIVSHATRHSTSSGMAEERKAAMVSNLLVVLCADREARPVVNTGALYG